MSLKVLPDNRITAKRKTYECLDGVEERKAEHKLNNQGIRERIK